MEQAKHDEIKALIDSRWSEDKTALCQDIMSGYIFGTYASNEHYTIDEIISIWDELFLDKNPLPEPEPIVEEPVLE